MAKLDRRSFLLGGTAIAAIVAIPFATRLFGTALGEGTGPVPGTFEVTHTEEEWRQILGDDAYYVMRMQGTEPPWSSALLNEHREGTFLCAGCDLPLFDSATKYDSGTGWPSFYQPLENAVGELTDETLGHGAHRSALPALRRPSRPRLQRRPPANGPALLHGRHRAEVRAQGGLGDARRGDPPAAAVSSGGTGLPGSELTP